MGNNRWDTGAYISLAAVEYNPHTKEIAVRFSDGDTAALPVKSLVYNRPFELDWPHLTIEESGFIHVPPLPDAQRDAATIPAFDMRILTDAEFATHLARKAEESARRIGERLRRLRKERGLTAKEVATRAGIAQQTITRIELGQHDVVFTTLEKILAAMGYTLHDVLPIEDGIAAE